MRTNYKEHSGITVSISLTAEETDDIARHLGVSFDSPEIRKYLRNLVKEDARKHHKSAKKSK